MHGPCVVPGYGGDKSINRALLLSVGGHGTFFLKKGMPESRGASLVAQTVKNLPAMQETQVQSLGREDHQEKGMATHSSILAWRVLWTEMPGGLQSMGSERVGQD